MRILAVLVACSLAVSARAQAPVPVSTAAASTASALGPIVITAPRLSPEEVRQLKQVRAAGGLAAVSGAGLMAYAAFFAGAGPVGWAAALLFFGGMTTYVSHQRLQGQDALASPPPEERPRP